MGGVCDVYYCDAGLFSLFDGKIHTVACRDHSEGLMCVNKCRREAFSHYRRLSGQACAALFALDYVVVQVLDAVAVGSPCLGLGEDLRCRQRVLFRRSGFHKCGLTEFLKVIQSDSDHIFAFPPVILRHGCFRLLLKNI